MANDSAPIEEITPRVMQLGCGRWHSMCRLDTGLILSWGRRAKHLKHPVERAEPRVLSYLTEKGISLIACGHKQGIAISQGQNKNYAWSWEDLDNRGPYRFEPRVVLANVIVNQVACGHRHTLLDTDAGLCAFGANEAGQLGVGSSATRVNTPRYVISGQIPEASFVTSIAAGAAHSLVSTDAGNAYAWGCGEHGRLGNGTTANRHQPTKVADLDIVIVNTVSCGSAHSAFIDGGGILYTFGLNNHGQLGHPDCENRLRPASIESPPNITRIACGGNHTVAADDAGNLYSWGDNEVSGIAKNGVVKFGQLGIGNYQAASSPQSIPLQGKRAVAVSCGEKHTIVVTDTAEVYGWGCGMEGQLGRGDEVSWNRPQLLEKLSHPNLDPDAFLLKAQSPTHGAGPSAGVSDVPGNTRAGTDEERAQPQTKKSRTDT